MNPSESTDKPTPLDQLKNNARAAWAAGDYPAVAQRQLWPVGERIVRHVGVRPGEDVLDVACGTGNAALRAAAAGARTVGVDLTPKLLEAGRSLAAEPPLAWGTEDHVRRLFSGTGMKLEFRRETVESPRLESIEAEIEFATTKFGPLIMARKFLEPQGRWPALLSDLAREFERQEPSEYLIILGQK